MMKKTSSSSSAQIKGGGRAVVSHEMEEDLVALLMQLRSPSKSDGDEYEVASSSKHERQREFKRFVKQLVAQHEREAAHKPFNHSESKMSRGGASAAKEESDASSSSSVAASVHGKVRIELAEALFSLKKAPPSKKNKKTALPFKVGTKKVMVVPRATTAAELCQLAKAKLHTKQKPKEAFCCAENKVWMPVPIAVDLRAIPDGTTIYVSATAATEVDGTTTGEATSEDEHDASTNVVDPLEAVKEAYKYKRKLPSKSSHRRPPQSFAEESYSVGFAEDGLPDLTEEQAALPAVSKRYEILQALEKHRVVIVRGATGSGKSTQVAQFIDQSFRANQRGANILVTQPRRVAAMALAARVADEMKCPKPGRSGSIVGYRVRLDQAVTGTCRIVYCTIGILLRMLICPQEDGVDAESGGSDDQKPIPLQHLSHLLIDEIHERDLNTDFCLTLLRSVLKVNQTLRVVLMSATASSELFLDYFTDFDPLAVDIPGKMFPVEVKWLQDCERFAGTQLQGFHQRMEKSEAIDGDENSSAQRMRLSPRAAERIDDTFIVRLIKKILHTLKASEAILAFLPGKGEIESLVRKIQSEDSLKSQCHIIRLHSSASRNDQESAFLPAPSGKFKVVLATNVAETSITIPDVTHVIDTGRVKESRFNASTRIKELVTVWTSLASAKQRCGRAGRTAAGVCWRLYSDDFASRWMPEQTPPEIIRTPLDELVLQICLLYEQRRNSTVAGSLNGGVCPVSFLAKAPEPPPSHSLVEACQHLLEVGALTVVGNNQRTTYRLTPLGYHLSRLPMDAKVGKVLLTGCILDCLDPALTVAAALSSTKTLFLDRWGKGAEDEKWKAAVESRKLLIENGYGGKGWKGGTVKGDMVAAIAAYDAWSRKKKFTDQLDFAIGHALDNRVLLDVKGLRSTFKGYLVDAGFIGEDDKFCNACRDDARLASCCLVAGLYPNVVTLMRPRKERGRLVMKGGRLITKSDDICRPGSGSFQAERVKNASETGKDAYAVFHAKHRTVGTNAKPGEVFLHEVNFVSRYALMLFGGELEVRGNALIVDGWLKFKVGDKKVGAILMLELRKELDAVLLKHMQTGSDRDSVRQDCQDVLLFVRKLLADE